MKLHSSSLWHELKYFWWFQQYFLHIFIKAYCMIVVSWFISPPKTSYGTVCSWLRLRCLECMKPWVYTREESVVSSFVFPYLIFCSKVSQIDSRTNPLEEVENDMNQETSIIQYASMKMWRKYCWNHQKYFNSCHNEEEWSFMW